MAAPLPLPVQAPNPGVEPNGDLNMSPNPRGRPLGVNRPMNLWNLVELAKRLAEHPHPYPGPGRPSGSNSGPTAKTQARLAKYAELFAQRDEVGKPLTLQQVGDAMGVTREMVRQIRKRYFPELDGIKEVRGAYINQRRKVERFQSVYLFRRMVRDWLHDSGYFQCCHCGEVKCTLTDRTKTGYSITRSARCKRCTADATWRWWQTPKGKKLAKAWVKANPGKQREYQQRCEEKRKRSRQGENHNNQMP